jgi:hypothetical protein
MAKLALAQTTAASVLPKPRVARLIDERIEKRAQLDQLTKDVKELDATILADVQKAGAPFETEAWKVSEIESSSSNISAELLLELGVKPSIIKKATKRTPYTYLKITVKGGAK